MTFADDPKIKRMREARFRLKTECNDDKASFLCPVCGSDSYTELRKGKRGARRPMVLHCICDRCSIHFSDPVKFSVHNKQSTGGK